MPRGRGGRAPTGSSGGGQERQRRLGPPPRREVELGEAPALGRDHDQAPGEIEVIGDVHELLVPLLGRRVRLEDPADRQVEPLAIGVRESGVGGLVDAIVEERVPGVPDLDHRLEVGDPVERRHVLVVVVDGQDEPLGQRRLEPPGRLAPLQLHGQGERPEVEPAAHAGRQAHDLDRFRRERRDRCQGMRDADPTGPRLSSAIPTSRRVT